MFLGAALLFVRRAGRCEADFTVCSFVPGLGGVEDLCVSNLSGLAEVDRREVHCR